MGKYMKKTKAAAEVAVMDVSLAGVRTRAKTLALQKSAVAVESPAVSSGGSYLQLRSRRLLKPPVYGSRKHLKRVHVSDCGNPNPSLSPSLGSRSRASSRLRVEGSFGSISVEDLEKTAEEKVVDSGEEIGYGDNNVCNNNSNDVDLGIEASLGENVLEFESRDRGTRESTPCSLIREAEMVRTPGSSTRPTRSVQTSQRIDISMRRNIPTADEMNEFFAAAEQEQRRLFFEKYNFDPVNEKPFPGRFEWEKVDP